MYKPLARASPVEIIEAIRNRVSFYQLFRLYDSVDLDGKAIDHAKVRNQTYLDSMRWDLLDVKAYLRDDCNEQSNKTNRRK